jgi:type VI secretion system secreted protein VgrG
MARQDRLAVMLHADALGTSAVVVTRITGEEALSEPFQLRVEFFPSSLEPIEVHELFGTRAVLWLYSPGGVERMVHGIVDEVTDLGWRRGRPEYGIRLVPHLQRLSHIQRSRIFQQLSVPEIVHRVLKAEQIKHLMLLSGSYPPREYCTQFRESDLAFVRRLLEAEGIFFFFEHGPDTHVMVLCDSATDCQPLAGGATLPFRPDLGLVPEHEHITRLARTHRLLPSAVELRDFDFTHPSMLLSARVQEARQKQDLEVYDHPGEYIQATEGTRLSRVRLEELRFGVYTLSGESTCHRLVPGATFSLEYPPDRALAGQLLVVRVRHRWQRPEGMSNARSLEDTWCNEFTALPAGVRYRPRRVTHRPFAPGLQTATVVGPPGQESHPDPHGRIKIQFHWDREGRGNEQSSCWVRVGQPWAGCCWGSSFIPRVGQEVVVRFLEGNPDRPLVVGAVYNGSNPPPLALPEDRTRSTLRTDSSPRGEGFNELRFEDAAGAEEIYLRAQRDETLEVLNDKAQRIGGNEALLVEQDREKEVSGQQSLAVKLDDVSVVDGSQTLQVTGNRETRIQGNHSEHVEGNQATSVTGAHALNVKEAVAMSVGAAAALNVGAAYSVNVALDSNAAVGGARLEQTGGIRTEAVGLQRSESIGGDRTSQVVGTVTEVVTGKLQQLTGKDRKDDVGRHALTEVKGATSFATKQMKLEAKEFALVVGGELALLINKSGTVKIWAKSLTIDGSRLVFKGNKIKKERGGGAQSKPFQEVLDASVAAEIATYDPDNPGPLSPDDAKNFKDSRYTERVLTKDVTMYRLHGGGALPQGRWVSAVDIPPGLEGRIRLAVHPAWGGSANQVSAFTLKAGTRVYEGIAASQGTGYVGGSTQILINVPKSVLQQGKHKVAEFLQQRVFL